MAPSAPGSSGASVTMATPGRARRAIARRPGSGAGPGGGPRRRPGTDPRGGPRRWPAGVPPGGAAAAAIRARDASISARGAEHEGRAPRRHPLGQERGVEDVPVVARGLGHVDGPRPVHLEIDEARGQDLVVDGTGGAADLDDDAPVHDDLTGGDRPRRGEDGGRPHDGGRGAGHGRRTVPSRTWPIPGCRYRPIATSPWAWSASTSPNRGAPPGGCRPTSASPIPWA